MDNLNYKHSIKKTADLIPYVNNSRTHSDEQINQIAASIKEFGFTNPILIDDKCGVIAGHGRIMAANKLGIEKVPCITLSGLSKAQIKAYSIADNQLPLNAGWDLDGLRLELETLKELDFDLDMLGFDDDFVEGLLDIDCELVELPNGDKDPFQQITFTLHDEQANLINDAISKAKKSPSIEYGINTNTNGNAIFLICKQWVSGSESN